MKFEKVTKTYLKDRSLKNDMNCWLWQKQKDSCGYGIINTDVGQFRAHRFAAYLWQGAIFNLKSKMLVCHSCDIPSCINPEHLWIANQSWNMADMQAKGRHADFRGSKHPSSRLTEDIVLKMRNDFSNGMTLIQTQKKYTVTKSMAFSIKKRKSWRHI